MRLGTAPCCTRAICVEYRMELSAAAPNTVKPDSLSWELAKPLKALFPAATGVEVGTYQTGHGWSSLACSASKRLSCSGSWARAPQSQPGPAVVTPAVAICLLVAALQAAFCNPLRMVCMFQPRDVSLSREPMQTSRLALLSATSGLPLWSRAAQPEACITVCLHCRCWPKQQHKLPAAPT